ncbi:MAG: hypothetical protein R6V58_00775 [Planctomycetota bacterium]
MGARDRDEEQCELCSYHKSWRLIAQRRRQKTLTRVELEARSRQGS